jgi:hypothetical protein
MNKHSFHIKFYLLKNREKDGKQPLYCRIGINRKKSEFSLHEWIEPKKWKEPKVVGDPELTARISSIHAELHAIRNRILDEGRIPTSKEVRDKYLKKDELSTDLLEYVSSYIDQMIEIGDRSHSTIKKYRTIAHHLEEFLRHKNQTNITLKGFSPVLAKEVELYLRTEAKLSNNTAVKYMKLIKTIFNRQ